MENKITFDKFIRWTLAVAGLVITCLIINYLGNVLLPFVIAWFFAYLLNPVVDFVQHKLYVKIRAVAIVITMLLVIVGIGAIVMLIVPPMIEQFQRLEVVASNYIRQTTHTHSIGLFIQNFLRENEEVMKRFFQSKDFTEILKSAMPKVFSILGQTASVVISIVASCITLLYLFFILLDYEYLTTNWIKIFPKKQRPFWNDLMDDVKRELNNYIRGQGLVALCMGIMFCIGFTIIGFPMGIALGILIGILDLVPYLHTFALIPTAIIALLEAADKGENFWWIFGMAVLVFIIVQLITDLVVTPKIMGKAMGLNPAILLFSLSIWGALLGFIGLIIALPVTTLVIAYWQRYVTKDSEIPNQT